jgi:hypothetical protein
VVYRNGTYVAFHAEGTSNPAQSDMKYFNTLKMWDSNKSFEFSFNDSHEKGGQVRNTSTNDTLEARLKERLRNSKNMILIIGETTKDDTDWIPLEIEYAVDTCEIPIIAAYPGYDCITKPEDLSPLWPKALKDRINNGIAHVIHVTFRKEAILDAITQFTHEKLPTDGKNYYTKQTYINWGYIKQ